MNHWVKIFFLFIITITSCHLGKRVTNPNVIQENKLQSVVKSWMGAPYKFGGNTRQGIDCSGLVFQLYKDVYNKVTPRTSKSLYEAATKISEKELQEGDLVFFNIDGKGISHVGIYIGEDKFVHASSRKGVVLSLLSEDYYKKHFVSFGKLR